MKISFRTDASVQIGSGHVMRCLTLAEELRRRGHDCGFICKAHQGHLGDLIAKKGFKLDLLNETTPEESLADNDLESTHTGWLGGTWQMDANQTQMILAREQPDWLVVDHYALGAQWERLVASEVGQIMVIDDLADRDHECSILLDQNVLDSSGQHRYQRLVNENCILLLGPRYALLRPEYAELANALPERDGTVVRVLIFVGGSDPHHLTERYLEALTAPEFSHLLVDVVVGANHPSPAAVERLVEQRAKTRLYSQLPSLSALMVRADLMLGAGGATNWERMCLGLNALVVSVADNQYKINEALGNQRTLYFLGKVDCLTADSIHATLRTVREYPKSVAEQSSRMRALVDGNGCERVAQLLIEKCI
ncbi:UDP-2,4-diacetamido-2,4,6-trideoxy-beta-L-altropyranose hydrolase [Marinobacter szutsaonensis]